MYKINLGITRTCAPKREMCAQNTMNNYFFLHTAQNFFAHSVNAPTLPPVLIVQEQAEDRMEGENAQKKIWSIDNILLKNSTTYSPLNLSQRPKPHHLVLHWPATQPAARRTPIMVPRPLVKQKLPPKTHPLSLLTSNQENKHTAYG